jgi:hypothetical protein
VWNISERLKKKQGWTVLTITFWRKTHDVTWSVHVDGKSVAKVQAKIKLHPRTLAAATEWRRRRRKKKEREIGKLQNGGKNLFFGLPVHTISGAKFTNFSNLFSIFFSKSEFQREFY